MRFPNKPWFICIYLSINATFMAPALGETKLLSMQDAVLETLLKNDDLKLADVEISISKGSLKATGGSFDTILSSSISETKDKTASFSQTTGLETQVNSRTRAYTIGAAKTFKNGVTVDLTNENTTYRVTGSQFQTIGTADWKVTFTVPLLQNAGQNVLTNQRLAEKNLKISELNMDQNASFSVYRTVKAYWSNLASQTSLQNIKITMETAQNTSQTLKQRKDGGELAEVDYQRALAELRLREADFEDGVQTLLDAEEELMHAIGTEPNLNVTLSNSTFPEPASADQLKLVDEEQLLILAIKRRSDLKIKDIQVEIERIKLKKLENKKLPTLDFFVSGGSSAASSNFSDSHGRKLYTDSTEIDGPDYTAGITAAYPLGNHAATGAFKSGVATLEMQKLLKTKMIRNLQKDIASAMRSLKSASKSYILTMESLKLLEIVEQEIDRKLDTGEATLTDMISVQDRITSVRLGLVRSLNNYSSSLADLRYLSGTLINKNEGVYEFTSDNVFKLPFDELKSVSTQ